MNARQSKAFQGINVNENNNNYPTDNPVAQTVQNLVKANGQDKENVSGTSSAKQRREERTKKFDIDLDTKMRLKRAWFE